MRNGTSKSPFRRRLSRPIIVAPAVLRPQRMKVRTLLKRRKRRQQRSVDWRRWSNEYLYNVLGLYWDWKVHPLPSAEDFA